MELSLTSVQYHTQSAILYHSNSFVSPAYYIFSFEQLDAPSGVNVTIEIALFPSDKRVKEWMAALDEGGKFVVDISIKKQ